MNLLQILFLVVLQVHLIIAEDCNTLQTCGSCIGSPEGCVWCSAKNHTGPRCEPVSVQNKSKSWCIDTVNPQHEFNITRNEDFSSTIQFRPQHIRIKARPGVSVNFNMSYFPAKDYPLDLYYLMDVSYTMNTYREMLKEQAERIYKELSLLTNNVLFGVGTFVEKLALPYASPFKHTAYSFKNDLPLTTNSSLFRDTIGKLPKHLANYDDPESSLDALMQAIVCQEIGWRNDTRRIIVVSTDSTYHSAGDGKMVGAIKRNDMKCHLDGQKHSLEASLLYDYPSVSQINEVARKNKVIIIFTVLNKLKDVYVALADRIQGAKYVELSLESDVVNMIKTEYEMAVRNMQLVQYTPDSPYIELKSDPPCTKSAPCEVAHRQAVVIGATLKILKCPVEKNYKHVMEIGPSGLNEKLTINIEIDCECECEKEEKNSGLCGGKGVFQCGICKCNPGSFGDSCECTGSFTTEEAIDNCKTHKNDTEVCSGRGICKCGECECDTNYNGAACQYIAFCPLFNSKACADNGVCSNGSCICNEGWSGDDCSCTLDQTPCMRDNMICSGNGVCKCGQCECSVDSNNKVYSGQYCDMCGNCDCCVELQNFAECHYTSKGKNGTCNDKLNDMYTVRMLNKTEMNASEFEQWSLCKKPVKDGNIVVFKCNKNFTVLIQEELELPAKAKIWIPVCSAIGGIVLIGLLTLILWKVLTDMYYAKEYEKFAKRSREAGFDIVENPLYRPAATNIMNPAYRSS